MTVIDAQRKPLATLRASIANPATVRMLDRIASGGLHSAKHGIKLRGVGPSRHRRLRPISDGRDLHTPSVPPVRNSLADQGGPINYLACYKSGRMLPKMPTANSVSEASFTVSGGVLVGTNPWVSPGGGGGSGGVSICPAHAQILSESVSTIAPATRFRLFIFSPLVNA